MKLRIKFAKTGVMRFVGHLDVMRFFQKAIRRAGIAVAYSGGYSPHQIMSFAAPLGVGLESVGEYMDIEVHSLYISPVEHHVKKEENQKKEAESPAEMEAMDAEEIKDALKRIKDRLNAEMVPGMEALCVTLLEDHEKNAMASVAAASYRVRFREGKEPDGDWISQFNDWVSQDTIPVQKKTKKGELSFDLKPALFMVRAEADRTVSMLVDASSSGNVKPSFVMDAFMRYTGRETGDFAYAILREETYTVRETETGVQWIPLDAVGKEA